MIRKLTNSMRGLLTMFAVLALAVGLNAQSTLMTESWETAAVGQVPPTSWAVDVVASTNAVYFAATGTYPTITPQAGTRMVQFQSFNYSSSVQRLKRTAAISTVNYTNATLNFWWSEDPGYSSSNDRVQVQYSLNGTTWTDAGAAIPRYNTVAGWKQKSVVLPANANGAATVYVAFLFTSAYGNNCYLDNVTLTAVGPPPPATVTIGTGTSTSAYPYTTYWMDGRTQLLYTAAEITAGGGAMGAISTIGFNVSSAASQLMNGFTISMKNSTATNTDGWDETGLTNVYSGTYAVPGTGWQMITLQTPFIWDGVSNLLINICYDNSSYSSYSYVYSSVTTAQTARYYYTDITAGNVCSTTSGTSTTTRPNLRFVVTPYVGTVIGKVTNNFNSTPIAGATVAIGTQNATTNASGDYTIYNVPAGPRNVMASATGFVSQTKPTTVVNLGTSTVNFALDPIPAVLTGTVTNAVSNTPIVGAKIIVGTKTIYSMAGGVYTLNMYPGGSFAVSATKLGYNPYASAANVTLTTGVTTTHNIPMFSATPAPAVMTATLNTGATAVDLTWAAPTAGYEIIYDDGGLENMTAWANTGNINAVKFTPINQYPVQITGGKVNIGDGSYPAGGTILGTKFNMAIFDDDGANGYPNTELARIEVTASAFGWLEYAFAAPITITSGNFYIGMIQGGNFPNCAPIAIDETTPSMRSYSKFVTGNAPWVPASFNDFMIRAYCIGGGGPLDLATSNNVPIHIESPARHNRYAFVMNSPKIVSGDEGEAIYMPLPINVLHSNPAQNVASSGLPSSATVSGAGENGVSTFVQTMTQELDATDAVLFNNGSFVNSPGTAPGGADESIIVAPATLFGSNFNQVGPYTVADNFTVTGTNNWAITSVDIFGYQTGGVTTASSFTGGFVRVWNGNPSVAGSAVIWGDLTTNRMSSSVWTNCYRVSAVNGGITRPIYKVVCSTPGLTLAPGTYWVEFCTTGSLASGPWVPVLGTPPVGNALQNTGTWVAMESPAASGNFLDVPFVLNGSIVAPAGSQEYQVWRLKQGEELTPAVWTSLASVFATTHTDNAWPSLPDGPYRWAVKAKYPGDRWSAATFSNVLGKGWTSNVTVNVTLSSVGAPLNGAQVRFVNTVYTDTTYQAMTPATGTVNWQKMWKGTYNLTVNKFGYQTYTATVNITGATHTFNVLLMESPYAPYNLFVDDRTLIATWNAPNPQIALFEEYWASSNFTANQWVVSGGNWAVSATGNPAPAASFSWSPQVTNYNQTITSKNIVGQGSPALYLKYDINLDNFGTTYENQMAVEIWDGTAWNRLKNYSNLGGSIPWTSESINITAYTWDTFKIRFVAYGSDSYDINYWYIDNILVVAALSDKSVLGYNVYLDDIQVGFTSALTYQINQNLCTYGQTYTASVDAIYESGPSARDYYTFMAKYLPPPINLTGLAIQDAAYLDWEEAVMPLKKSAFADLVSVYPFAGDVNPAAVQNTVPITDAFGNLQFAYNAAVVTGAAGNAGSETDGSFYYTTRWGSNLIHKWNLDGTLVEQFSIPGVTGLRDLAYDGTYFYGGAASTTLFKMDFVTKTLVQSISTSASVRSCAYDVAQTGFWVNNWADNLKLISGTGAVLQTLATVPPSMYGSAYDSWSAGGPFLWAFSGTSAGGGCQLQQLNITTGAVTGVGIPVSSALGATIAGGLWTRAGVVTGTVTIGGLAQGDGAADQLFGFELAPFAGGGGGNSLANLLGYNLYRDGNMIAYIEKPTTDYYDLYLNPKEYCYTVTAVYDLEVYGYPLGTTDESLEEGPACVIIDYGIPIPWLEDWSTAGFTYNNWSFAPSQGHWKISNMTGNAVPSAEFTWVPPTTDYSFAMESPALNAGIYDCAEIWLDFDLKLDDRNQTAVEKLRVDVYWDGTWKKVAEYKNEGSFNWSAKHIDISATSGKGLKVKFTAFGVNTADILGWYVDNINVYPVCNPASNLAIQKDGWYDVTLKWNAPECLTGPSGVLKMLKQWDGDPASQVNGYYQAYGSAYGVVYNLAAYSDATLSKIDFHHASWGTNGTWQYKIHIVDWATGAPIQVLGPFATTGNDKWETNVSLGDIMGYGGGQIGIMLEPLSNSSTDAYPCFSSDNDGPAGVSVFGVLPDYGTFGPSTIGDFYQSLWIITALDKSATMVQAPAIPVGQLQMAQARKATPPMMNLGSLVANQKELMLPTEGTDGVVGYNVYRDGVMINTAPILDTFLVTALPGDGMYCYKVAAVHEGYNAPCESPLSNEACLDVTGINNPATAQGISVFPNPAREFVNVKTTKDIRSLELMNYLGQSVYKQNVQGEGTFRINTRGYESGVYFVRFTDVKGVVSLERITIAK